MCIMNDHSLWLNMDAYLALYCTKWKNYKKKTDIARVNVDIFNLKKKLVKRKRYRNIWINIWALIKLLQCFKRTICNNKLHDKLWLYVYHHIVCVVVCLCRLNGNGNTNYKIQLDWTNRQWHVFTVCVCRLH